MLRENERLKSDQRQNKRNHSNQMNSTSFHLNVSRNERERERTNSGI